jgi:hypothetical protein
MPARFRRSGQHCAWADANRNGQGVDSFLGGACLRRRWQSLRHRCFLGSGIPHRRAWRLGPCRRVRRRAQRDEVHGRANPADRRPRQRPAALGRSKRSAHIATFRVETPRDSKISTTSSSTRAATCSSPTRARPACRTRLAGYIDLPRTASWTCCCPTCPVRTALPFPPTSRCFTWPSHAETACGVVRYVRTARDITRAASSDSFLNGTPAPKMHNQLALDHHRRLQVPRQLSQRHGRAGAVQRPVPTKAVRRCVAVNGCNWPLWKAFHNGHYEKTSVMRSLRKS